MRKYLLMVVLIVLVGAGAFWFMWEKGQTSKPQGNISGNTDIPLQSPTPSSAVVLPEPPAGYDVLKNNSTTLRQELKIAYTKKFAELVEQLKTEPGNSSLWVDLGSIKYAFEDFSGAEAAWKYAININPLADLAYVNLAAMYQYKTKNYPEAERMLRTVINARSPVTLQAYIDLFNLYRYRYTEKANLAEGVMLEAYRTFPNEHTILKALALHFLEKGDKKRAIEYFEKFLSKVPDDASAKEELERLKK